MYAESDYLMISGIQHFAFCRRQWALIHLEQQWAENILTAEGEAMHALAHDESLKEKRKDRLIVRALRVASPRLGVSGTCDVVEFTKDENGVPIHRHRGLWQPFPVEYKHGKEKDDLCDQLQLCCEAMCLEEMLGASIRSGAIFYHKTRRRSVVELNDELRAQVSEALEEMHQYARRGHTPKATPAPKCKSCSLKDNCLPKLAKRISPRDYIRKHLGEGADA